MVKAEIYFHINNGGVTLMVEDNGSGPEIRMKASHSGHKTGCVSVMTTPEDLKKVADMFDRASKEAYSPPSCIAAHGRADDEKIKRLATASFLADPTGSHSQ